MKGVLDKEKKKWGDLAHGPLSSSFVYSTYERERAEENAGFCVCATHAGLTAFIRANAMSCGFTFCSSPDLGTSTWDRRNAV